MDNDFTITEVKIRLADEPRGGLIGWASCVLNRTLFLDSIAVFRKEDGEFSLSFPKKMSERGAEYHFFKPITHAAYEQILTAIVKRLNLAGKESP
jgi:DNA-binding cell septation regulator SpoVG